jgi:glutamine amidotransferase
VPEFLRGGIRGDTDAEVVFHIMLSFLHDAGRLNDSVVEPQAMREALRSTLAVVDGTTAEAGVLGQLNLVVANGEEIVAVHRSDAAMAVRTLSGKVDGDMLLGDDLLTRRKVPELAQMRFSIVASDFDEGTPNGRWKAVPERAIVTLSRDEEPRIEAL